MPPCREFNDVYKLVVCSRTFGVQIAMN